MIKKKIGQGVAEISGADLRKVSLAEVKRTCGLAQRCTYHSNDETLGPIRYDSSTSTSRRGDQTRAWNTELAIEACEDEFGVILSGYEIVAEGPWRNTVEAIRRAIAYEKRADVEFDKACEEE